MSIQQSDILEGQDIELRFLQRQSRQSRRVQLEHGESAKVRFLPAQLGPHKRWYARIANHWIYKKPYACPINTSPDYGGSEEAECPLCATSDALNTDKNQKISDLGWSCRATPQWLTYCLVFAKSTARIPTWQEAPFNEILVPWELPHYKSSFEVLLNSVRNNVRKTNPRSVLDYEKGNDFILTKLSDGKLQIEKQDSEPIFDASDPDYAAWIKKIESACKNPQVKLLDLDQLDEIAQKLHEAAYRDSSSRSTGAVRRGRSVSDELDTEQPVPRSRRSEPRRAAVDNTEEGDDSNPDLVPARRTAPAAEEPPMPRQKAPVQRAPETEEEPEMPPASTQTRRSLRTAAPAASDADSAEPEIAPRRRSVPETGGQPPARRAPVEPETDDADSSLPASGEDANQSEQPVVRRKAQPARIVEDAADEDGLPEEARDPAPATDAEDGGTGLPPVRGGLGETLRKRITAVNTRRTA